MEHLLIHILVLAVLITVSVFVFHLQQGLGSAGVKLFNWHPLLLVIAFPVLMSESVVAFRSGAPGADRPRRKSLHWMALTVALALAWGGVACVFKFHADNGIPDLYSVHSWLGLLTMIVFTLQWAVGVWAFLSGAADEPTRKSIMPRHQYFGAFTYAMGMASVALGCARKQDIINDGKALAGFKYGADAMTLGWLAGFVVLLAMSVFAVHKFGRKVKAGMAPEGASLIASQHHN
jgi:cytochrome b-561|eukprot:TRINITY_DN1600_c0_g1_i1.p2 TRINITY_DN1600_c0_g1~~TRINITY_DN1600_c0_g1_i1.p2  ORF type:complete len:234 (+),score=111.30 TRINITY_DN1600_c0_g1_i1:347-1048(+)